MRERPPYLGLCHTNTGPREICDVRTNAEQPFDHTNAKSGLSKLSQVCPHSQSAHRAHCNNMRGPRVKSVHEPARSIKFDRSVLQTKSSWADSRSQGHDAGFFVFLSPLQFRLWWLGIGLLHVLCVGCFAFQCWAYWLLPGLFLGTSLETYQLSMPLSDFHTISVCFGLIAGMHGHALLNMLFSALRHQRFTIIASPKLVRQATVRFKSARQRIAGHANRTWVNVFGRRGILGVESNHFELIYITREVIETILQSILASHMSLLVPNVAVNRLLVLTIVLNCWSTPIIQHWFAARAPLARLLCLVFDVVLDFVSTVGIPLKLILPYWDEFNTDEQNFSYYLWYNDVWLVNMIHELQLVIISSWFELGSQLVFSFSLLVAMNDIKSLLCLAPPSTLKRKISVSVFPGLAHSKYDSIENKLQTISSTEQPAHSSLHQYRKSSDKPEISTKKRPSHALHLFLSLWGLLVLVFHVRASFGSAPPYCAMMARPWFSAKPACALMVFSCKSNSSATGDTAELDAAMTGMSADTLSHIVIRHCSYVEIPAQLHRFRELRGFKIYNSTLGRWDSDAEITAKSHPKIVFLFMVQVNMTQLPLGLLSDDFPPQLMDLEFCDTNLTTLPENLDQKWPHGAVVVFEMCPFESIPEVIQRLEVAYFSMVKDPIGELPDEVFTNPSAVTIWLNGVPIVALPVSLTPSESIHFVHLSNSDLEAFPSWMDAAFFKHAHVAAGGTPLCERMLAGMEACDTTALDTLGYAPTALLDGMMDCDVYSGNDLMYYPRDAEALLDSEYF